VTESAAIELARAYAAKWAVPWQRVVEVRTKRAWWCFSVAEYTLRVETGDGEAMAVIRSSTRSVFVFEYAPTDSRKFMLPPWAAYPQYDSVTTGWRQGGGELYMNRWYTFYRSLATDEQTTYKTCYAPPDDGRLWQDFYDHCDLPPEDWSR
jgi:hypothetical protein